MNIFKFLNFNSKEQKKSLIYFALISILIGQIIALIAWCFFKENLFFALLFGSIVGFLFGYRGLKK